MTSQTSGSTILVEWSTENDLNPSSAHHSQEDSSKDPSMLDAEDDLYGDVEVQHLPSEVDLTASFCALKRKRIELEQELEALKMQFSDSRTTLEQSTRNACVLLVTARLELQRKHRELKELENLRVQEAKSS